MLQQKRRKVFPGYSIGPFIGVLKTIIKQTGSQTVLDYGSGAGHQYSKVGVRLDGSFFIHRRLFRYWGVKVTCFDPAIPHFADPPQKRFDGVISTDVLEHIHEADLPWILEEMFQKAKYFLFVNVSASLAYHKLPNGANAHVTVKDDDWWRALFLRISLKYPQLPYFLVVSGQGRNWKHHFYSNGPLPEISEVAHLFPLNGGWSYFLRKKFFGRHPFARLFTKQNAHSSC